MSLAESGSLGVPVAGATTSVGGEAGRFPTPDPHPGGGASCGALALSARPRCLPKQYHSSHPA